MLSPSAHTFGWPAAQLSKRHPCPPGLPSGQVSTQLDPASQVTPQLWSAQVKTHAELGPQVQLPLAQVPTHCGLLPAQSTWQGPASQRKVQELPTSQVQVPLAQVPTHADSDSHSTWQGGAAHSNPHELPGPQWQSPLAHDPTQSGLSPSQST